jgi:hypothetical protein
MSSENLASIREAASSVYAVCTGQHTQLMQGLTFIELIDMLCQFSFLQARMPTCNVVLTDHQAASSRLCLMRLCATTLTDSKKSALVAM